MPAERHHSDLASLVTFGGPIESAPVHRGSRTARRLLLAIAFAAAIVAATVVAAAGLSNRPIQLERLTAAPVGQEPRIAIGTGPTSTDVASVEAAASLAGFRPATAPAFGSPLRVTVQVPPSDASGQRLGPVAVDLEYVLPGTTVQLITDGPTAATGPFHVGLKPSSTVSQPVETIDGNDYIVLRSKASGRVLLAGWQLADGRSLFVNAIAVGGIEQPTFVALLRAVSP